MISQEKENSTIIILEQKITDDLIPLLGVNVIIWILASRLSIIIRVVLVIAYSIISKLWGTKRLIFNDEHAIYELPLLKKRVNLSYNTFIVAHFRNKKSHLNEYMDVEIKYKIHRKKEIIIPVADAKTAIKLCKFLLARKIEISSNDRDIQKLVDYHMKNKYTE